MSEKPTPPIAVRAFIEREMQTLDMLYVAADGGGSFQLDQYGAQFVIALLEGGQDQRDAADAAIDQWCEEN